MFFVDKEHEVNFDKMMDLYDLSIGQDVEYESAIYIAAHPEIFKCYDLNKLDTEFGPLGCLLKDENVHNIGALTGTTRSLVEVGQSLYNGYKTSVADVVCYGDEMFVVFKQACEIRAGYHI
ncbi:TPA: hypothetical protein ACGW5B_005888 [Bacillus paranthracis]|uniref:hypothetical protein n=1 Tax=Bacillus paranthracis TaxID=2026186 RepID=UPI002FDB9DBA